MSSFYRHSGIVPARGLFQLLCAGLGTSMSAGIVYAYASYWLPIVHVNFLLTGAFGCGLGVLINHAARTGRIRNSTFPAIIGFLSGLVGLYFAWAADMHARTRLPWEPASLVVLRPGVLWDYIQWFYANGAWKLAHHKEELKGVPLAGVWLCEAAAIVGGATLIPWSEIRQWVFCERCRWWETIETNVNSLSAANADSIAERMLQQDFSVLREISPADPHDHAFLHLNLAYCETCDEGCYVDLDLTTVAFDKKGKAKTKKRRLVDKLAIPASDAPLVLEAGKPAATDPLELDGASSPPGDAVS